MLTKRMSTQDNLTIFGVASFGVILIGVFFILDILAWIFMGIVFTTIFNRLDINLDFTHSLIFLICVKFVLLNTTKNNNAKQ